MSEEPKQELAKYELRSGESWRDPFPMYRALRDHDPLHHVEDGDFYVLTRFADVMTASHDSTTFSSAQGLTVQYGELEAAGLGENTPMVFLDPPEHTDFRRLVTKQLTPRKVSTIEPDIREFVAERVENLKAAGSGDIVAELFKALPSFVVAHYLGVPVEDRVLFDRWTEAIVQAAASSTSGGKMDGAGNAFEELITYFVGLVERKKSDLGEDITSDLIRLGEDEVSIARILGFAFTMVTGGNDTITGMLSGAAALLTQHPEHREILRADPSKIPNAIEEYLRITSPVQGLTRTATCDVEFHGKTIPKGRRVLLCYGAANTDEREFGPDAGEVNVERHITKILTFASGTHYCIGAAAARLQGRVVLEELLTRCPDFKVDVEAARYAAGNYVRRHVSMPWSVN